MGWEWIWSFLFCFVCLFFFWNLKFRDFGKLSGFCVTFCVEPVIFRSNGSLWPSFLPKQILETKWFYPPPLGKPPHLRACNNIISYTPSPLTPRGTKTKQQLLVHPCFAVSFGCPGCGCKIGVPSGFLEPRPRASNGWFIVFW